jgi:lipopolysaccharide export system protein LptA
MAGQYFIRRARLACPEGLRVSADSLIYHESLQLYELFGRTSFENAQIRLTSRDAQYQANQDRITAQGGARLQRKEDGSTVTGESIELLQRSDQRPQDQLTATGGRPHAVLAPEPRAGATPDSAGPIVVDADRIVLRGEDLEANGNAQLTRGDLEGSGNEIRYVANPGQLLLTGAASLLTETYDLTGGVILLQMPNGQVEEVTAREGATLDSERLKFEAPLIYFVLQDGELEQLIGGRDAAWAPVDSTARARPIAISEDFTITGDSLVVTAPAGDLESVLAIGGAHATSTAGDLVVTGLSPAVANEDWIEGDEILATFARPEPDTTALAPTLPADSAAAEKDFRLERLRARVNARAFYRMPVNDSSRASAPDSIAATPVDSTRVAQPAGDGDCVAFHYVTGHEITILLDEGSVTSMEIEGDVAGTHFEPPCASGGAPPGGAAQPAPGSLPGAPPPPPPSEAARPSARVDITRSSPTGS